MKMPHGFNGLSLCGIYRTKWLFEVKNDKFKCSTCQKRHNVQPMIEIESGITIERACALCRRPFDGDGVGDGVLVYCSDDCKNDLLALEADILEVGKKK